MRDLIEALTIFLKYTDPEKPNVSDTNCEHDQLIVCIDPARVTSEDLARLDELGFSANEDDENFYSYRHGSC